MTRGFGVVVVQHMVSVEVKIVNILLKSKIKKMELKESNSKKHFYISLFKSVLRLGACYFLFNEQFGNAAITFGLAEILGIIEEL
jgi:hypothetical protein